MRAEYTSRLLALAGAFAALVLLEASGAGCSGSVLQIGSNAEGLTTLDPNGVSAGASACPAGYEHPNLCCTGGPDAASVCGVHDVHPFRPCDDGWTTYPDPRDCCPLDGGVCIPTPSGGGPLPGTGCAYDCPPGWWAFDSDTVSSNGAAPTACCRQVDGVSAECTSGSSPANGSSQGCAPDAQGLPEPLDASAGDVSMDDASVGIDAGAPDPSPPSCGDAGPPLTKPPASCDPECPDGWIADGVSPALCCRTRSGERECFSHASGDEPVGSPPPPVDAGTSSPYGCAGGQNQTCSCSSDVGTQAFELVCDDVASTCTCVVDGVEQKTIPDDINACAPDTTKLRALWQMCGFPV